MRQQRWEQESRMRAELIVQVRSGGLTVAEAARRLGISRKTYYKWERRALAGMMSALDKRCGGRPPTPMDEEKEQLRRDIAQLRRQLLLAEQRLAIQQLVHQQTQIPTGGGQAEKTKKKG